ncbi:hypothetical protein WA026_003035 [Henosepilachna vigintioctopunctata]|uniref:DNA-directed DNA polymerase n=1 Tax=Henosepilachna vigintioctopunctata TaxID=420089 RepID=A0AAW1TMX1_9CUCU
MKKHYCWIKHLSRLVSSQLNNHQHKKYLCDRCLNYFSTEIILNEHYEICVNANDIKVSFPKYDYVEFKNHIYKLECPFVIYADFECSLEKCDDKITEKLRKYQEHRAFSAGYYLKCSFDENLSRFKSNRADTCMNWFVNELGEVAKEVTKMMKDIKPMDVSNIDTTPSKCHICEKCFNCPGQNSESKRIVMDHDHFTGKFRGYAHNACNLNFRKQFVIPIVFHNFSGYDSHFIIRELVTRGAVTVLPVNKDKYISVTYTDSKTRIKFRFIDSYRFLGASLDALVSTLIPEDLKIIRREFKHLDDVTFQLLTRKGVFPYDYIDSVKKLEEPDLPARGNFYNKLTDANVDEKEYQHAQNVWKQFNIKTLGEYSDLYLKTDILLLADVMENFRTTAFKTYGLDPAWTFTMPGYTWQCMLKYTGCKLRILKDVDMLMFIEKSIRGGISVCTHRYSEANNKYMEDFDPSKHSKYILYLDVNNLYGYSMTQYLPYDDFEWTDTNIDVTQVSDDSPEGYILQVDLEYPQNLHNLHKDFPFCAEHRNPPGSNLKKLMTTLFDKKEYILHYRSLKQALKNGLILTKIHKVLKFKQAPWLKPYIDLNSELRREAVSIFAKNQYKLANNAVYGKTMENVRRYRDVKLVSKWGGRYGAKNLIASPRFESRTIFGGDLVAVEMRRAEVVFDKPLYIGMAILDISKAVMYDFHYDFMLRIFEVEACKLLYMDTDSFLYELTCQDAYEYVIKNNIEYFDTSDYSKGNIYNIPLKNKKVPGLMKDEANGEIITHFVGLRSKMYSYKVQTGEITKKAKGVKKHIIKNKITFEDYVNCLKNNTVKEVNQRSIRSFNHNVYSIEQSKIGLSAHDDKRQIIRGSFETLPWGYLAQNDRRVSTEVHV